jgi:hypothetical protein
VLPAAMLQSARCLLHCCLRRFCRYSVPAASSLRCKANVVTLLDKRAQQYPLGELTLHAQERAFGQSHPVLIGVVWVNPNLFKMMATQWFGRVRSLLPPTETLSSAGVAAWSW